MPRYEYECKSCDTRYDLERPMDQASDPGSCPFCSASCRRVFTAPKFLFKSDMRDMRPVWHNHGAYGHAHAPGRGFHGRRPADQEN